MKTQRATHVKYIESRQKRVVAFSKRKKGLLNKAERLSVLTGSRVLVLILSNTNRLYTYSSEEFKDILEQCKIFMGENTTENENTDESDACILS